MNGWSLAFPAALLLLPLPLLAALALPPHKAQLLGLRIPLALRDRFRGTHGGYKALAYGTALAWLAWIFLIVALAGPRIVAASPALPASGRDIMLALDLSGSMTKEDFTLDGTAASRLNVLKRIGSELIRRRAGDRIGLVIFAESAFAAAPLSFDVAAVSQSLNEMEIGLVGRSTAIGEGLGLALKHLSDSKATSRVIILLSDGANNAGSADPAAVSELAKTMGVKVFSIGLGINDTSETTDDRDAVDFAALRHFAETTGGSAFRARTTEEFSAATQAIEALVPTPIAAPPTLIYRDLWIYPAALALMACLWLALIRRSTA